MAIDTSGPKAFVALEHNDRFLEEVSKSIVSHSEELAPLVESLFVKAGLKASELKSVILGEGPGSFTGLRIGYSYASGLASSLGVKVTTISSHLASAIEFLENGAIIAVLGDARRDEAFVSAFMQTRSGAIPETLIRDEILRVDSLQAVLDSLCAKRKGSKVVTVSQDPFLGLQTASPSRLARGLILAFKLKAQCQNFIGPKELSQMTPNYVRLPSAKTVKERQRAQI